MSFANEAAAFDAPVDSRIVYPCYKSFDDIIDAASLRSLDHYIAERVRRHAQAQLNVYFQNEHRLDEAAPIEPGVREIWLSRTKVGVPYNYLDLDKPELWEPSEAADEFPLLMDFIATLPFEATGRMLIIYDDATHAVPAHRDHMNPDLCHHFIWLRTNRNKPFYVLNHKTGHKLYVESYSAWFDTVNQFHGTDTAPGLAFSIRIDGRFKAELRRSMPVPQCNPASTAALWACTSNPASPPNPG
jgi:hypothetical protein